MNGTLNRCRLLAALLGTLATAFALEAQPPGAGDMYPPDDIQQTVVRVAYFSGAVSYSRGDDPDSWQPASLNFPMTVGDRLYTAKGARLELQTGHAAIYVAPDTDLTALNLTDDVSQFSLGTGSASFRIRRIGSREAFEVDTPNASVTFDRPGDYRIDVDREGDTRVIVTSGHAWIASGGGEVPLEAGRLMTIDGLDSPVYDVVPLPRKDSWDKWVDTRGRRLREVARYVNQDIPGVEDLDEFGRWSDVPGYGTCWSPTNVSADWQPYRAGRWAWQDPWGWSWVSVEPWGWAPYHYGRWAQSHERWYWVPVGPSVQTVRYAPALVAFVGGPGFSISVSTGGGAREAGGGYVGWFPLAPHDPFIPWWGAGSRSTSAANVTYVNRASVTVVHQNTFVSGAPVATNVIRDQRTIHEISSAPVVRGPVQILPVAASIRVSAEKAGSAPRPPAAVLNRGFVSRLAPPPAPAPFHEKEALIRQNRGAPVTPAEAVRLQGKSPAPRPVRPAAVEGARVTLVPKDARTAGPAPAPVTQGVPPGQAKAGAPPDRQQQTEAAGKAQKQQSEAVTRAQQQQAAEAQKAQQQAEGARKQQQDQEVRKQQQAAEAQKAQQQAEGARKQQQDQEIRKQQAAEAQKAQQQAEGARKQQQDQEVRKQQQAAEAQKAQQQAEGARKQQQDQEVRKQQQAAEAQKAQQQAEGARKQQQDQEIRKQQAAEAQKTQQQAEGARKQQQDQEVRKQQAAEAQKAQQQAEGARKQQQDQEVRKQQQAAEAQKAQQQAEGARKQQQEQELRKQQQAEQVRRAPQQEGEAVRKPQPDPKQPAPKQPAPEKGKPAEGQKDDKGGDKDKKPPTIEEKH